MTFNGTSSIRFSVEESVWFKKGQEVSDLIGISLEPEISVHEHDNYISIRGALVLAGEYRPQTQDDEEQEINSLRDSAIYRTVDEVIHNDDGNLTMKHRFPIDITIPTNRIRSLEDVYVLVESFDYEIPETGRLELKADLCISGIANEREATPAAERQTEQEQEREQVPQSAFEEQELHGMAQGNPWSNGIPVEQDIRGEVGIPKDQEIEVANSAEKAEEARQVSEDPQQQPVTPQPSSIIENVTNNEGLGSAFRQKVFDTFIKTEAEGKNEEVKPFPSFTTEVRKQVNNHETVEEDVATEVTESPVAEKRAEVNLTLVSKGIPNQNDHKKSEQVEEQEVANRPVVAEAETSDVTEAVLEDADEIVQEVEESAIPVNIVAKKSTVQIGMKGRSEQQEQGWNPKSLYGTQQAVYNTSGARENVQEEEENETAQKQRSIRTENALYLTKMLSSEGDEDFSKLRLRIVQNGETIGTIAEMYDISTNQIIRLNGLDDEIVKEGQILYIPAYAGVEK